MGILDDQVFSPVLSWRLGSATGNVLNLETEARLNSNNLSDKDL